MFFILSHRSPFLLLHIELISLLHSLQLAGSVTAIFNCQGPLDTPTFVGSALVSRKLTYLPANTPESTAYEAMMKNKEAGAVAAIDRIPFSYISANFTFNTDNCVSTMAKLSYPINWPSVFCPSFC